MASNYARNVVHCKLSSFVGSQPQLILGVEVFDQLSDYQGWRCCVYSEFEFQTFVAVQRAAEDTFALVPEFNLSDVGRVDYAIFVPQVSVQEPLLVIEVDNHNYHSRPNQISNDHRRDCALTRRGIPFSRVTATDVLRNSVGEAREIVETVHIKLQEIDRREAERVELQASSWNDGWWNEGYQCGDDLLS